MSALDCDVAMTDDRFENLPQLAVEKLAEAIAHPADRVMEVPVFGWVEQIGKRSPGEIGGQGQLQLSLTCALPDRERLTRPENRTVRLAAQRGSSARSMPWPGRPGHQSVSQGVRGADCNDDRVGWYGFWPGPHAAVYAKRSDIDQVVVFGRSPQKLAKINDQFGFATTTDLDAVITDPSVDLVDICLPTKVHAEVAVPPCRPAKAVLVELPLATTLEDAHRIVAAQQASGRRAFVDLFSRFSAGNQHLSQAVADQRYGPLKVLEIEGRTALLWEGYDLGLQTLALDMMHADFDLVTGLLGRPRPSRSPAPEAPLAAARPLLSTSATRTPSPAVPARR
jgi:hypothetical protein